MCTTTPQGGQEKQAGNPMDGARTLLTNATLCQARTRAGGSCRCPAVRGKRRCRMHGGRNPGAPKGERNGMWKHGGETIEAVALRRDAGRLLRALRQAGLTDRAAA